ncbi:protein kinase domain-containing protein [Nocardioides sp. SYSU DS0651]|uniref:protein kinase domain-containing protein n=1 Tax=Nocardioides sp. SYSU DS0651 TaxID=3415955 RepID=UPI003F4C5632
MTEYADPAGRYRLDSMIATGGMGVVWRATDTRLNRPVAVKVLKTEYADDPTFRTRFEGEARSAAALHHPGIAGIYDYGAGESSASAPPYLVMELVDGQPLSALLADARASGRTLDAAVVQDLMAQASDALGAAHRAGIVHRDVKPANLLVTPDRRIKITDFGIARAADAVALTRTGSVMGTPQYLSPEQARGNPSTPASDVYSLGVVAFECLTGRRPFEKETPVATALAHLQEPVPTLPESVPADLAAVVTRALAKDPAQRYDDGSAFATALREPDGAAAGLPTTPAEGATQVLPPVTSAVPAAERVPPPAPMERLTTPAAYAGTEDPEQRRRKPWLAALVVILLVVAAIVVAALLLGNDDDDPVADDTATTPAETVTEESSSPTEPTTSATTEDTSVQVDASDYVGRDYREVEDDLSALGLRVTLQSESNDGSQQPDRVSRVEPSGALEEGDRITVYYWGSAPPPPETEPTEPTGPTDPTLPTDLPTSPDDGEGDDG